MCGNHWRARYAHTPRSSPSSSSCKARFSLFSPSTVIALHFFGNLYFNEACHAPRAFGVRSKPLMSCCCRRSLALSLSHSLVCVSLCESARAFCCVVMHALIRVVRFYYNRRTCPLAGARTAKIYGDSFRGARSSAPLAMFLLTIPFLVCCRSLGQN